MTTRDRCCSVVISLQLLGAVVAPLVVAMWRQAQPDPQHRQHRQQQQEQQQQDQGAWGTWPPTWWGRGARAASALLAAADRWLCAVLGEGLLWPQQLVVFAAVLAASWTAASVAACKLAAA